MMEVSEKISRMLSFNNILERKINEVTHPIFHYCSIESFLHILASGEMWASHFQSMNDYLEGRMFHQLLTRESINYTSNIRYPVIQQFIANWELNIKDYYICCFSKKPDILSQWYMYADEGRGVCIGFLPESFNAKTQIPHYNLLSGKNYGIFPVMYHSDSEIESAKLFLDLIVDGTLDDIPPRVDEFSIGVKHRGFSQEEEIRIVEIQDFRMNTDPDANGLRTRYTGDHYEFRVKNRNSITSYRKFPFKNHNGEICLHSIWIGPECQLKLNQLSLLLNRYRCTLDKGIYYSDSPFTKGNT
jgi:hypothetical protein